MRNLQHPILKFYRSKVINQIIKVTFSFALLLTLHACSGNIAMSFTEQYGEENMKMFDAIDSKASPLYSEITGSYNLKAVKINGVTRNPPLDTTGYWLELLPDGRMIEWHSKQDSFCNCIRGFWKLRRNELLLRYKDIVDFECGNNREPKATPVKKEYILVWQLTDVNGNGMFVKTNSKGAVMLFPRGEIDRGYYSDICNP